MSIKNSYISEGFDLSHEKMGIYIEEFADNSTQLTIELEVIPRDSYNSPTFTFADLYDVKNVRDILNEYIEIVEKEL